MKTIFKMPGTFSAFGLRTVLLIFAVIAAALPAYSQKSCPAGKSAIMIAHYGSSDARTRAKTIDLFNEEVRKAYPEYEIAEAYISQPVIERMARNGIRKATLQEALSGLHSRGYKNVYIQCTTLTEGIETGIVRSEAAGVKKLFDKIEVGNPLLYSLEDCRNLVDILSADTAQDEAIVYVGHGNALHSTSIYSMLEMMFKEKGKDNIYVSTIEGYPTAETLLAQLGKSKVRKVTLVPLLLTCGNHTKVDIAGTFKSTLEGQGYEVRVEMKGMGEREEIRRLFISHLNSAIGESGCKSCDGAREK